MRKIIIGFIVLTFSFILSIGVFSQPPRPPANKGTIGNQPPPYTPVGSPIEPGTGIMLILAAAYGLKKVNGLRKK